MAIVKSAAQAAASWGSPPPPGVEATGRALPLQGQGFLLMGRRERAVAVTSASFTSLSLRAAVALTPGSWTELRLAAPFAEGTWVGGIVRACEPEVAGAAGNQFSASIELHAVSNEYPRGVERLWEESDRERSALLLCVDADPLGRAAAVATLRGTGELREAASREETAKHLLGDPVPDVLVLAARMPDFDGIAFVRSLAEGGWLLPAVILSSRIRVDDARAAQELAGHPYRLLEKPSGREELRAYAAEMVAQGRALRRRAAREQAQRDLYGRLRESHRQLRRAAGSYLSTPLLDQAASSGAPASQSREISILFADIRNSTKFVDRLPPQQAVEIVNRVLSELADAVETHGGMVDKFLGDGLLGLFGAMGGDPHHRHRALAAARTMVNRVRSLAGTLVIPAGLELAVGVGVHCGPCILGNVGSEYRREFTALGAPVNAGARLQALAGPNQVVLPLDMARGLEDVAQFESLGTHALKGFEKPVEVVRVKE